MQSLTTRSIALHAVLQLHSFVSKAPGIAMARRRDQRTGRANVAVPQHQEASPTERSSNEIRVDSRIQTVAHDVHLNSLSNTDRSPLPRDPHTPFYADALPFWVLEDEEGQSKLVSELIPGCRHWRIGDPNVDFCVACNDREERPSLGCHTCKRSYHHSCLEVLVESLMYDDNFYCQICMSRRWNIEPPRDILPFPRPAASEQRSGERGAQDLSATASATDKLRSKRPLLPSSSSGLSSMASQPKPAKRRSRYQTVSDEVDQAMSTIYRELESVSEMKLNASLLNDRISQLEQEQRMQAGQFALEREQMLRQSDGRNAEELESLRASHDRVMRENEELRRQLELERSIAAARTKEVEQMKASMRQWLDK